MCLRCTAWTETQEPGVTPAPLETGHISVEEQNGEVWAKKYTDPSDFFPDDVLPQVWAFLSRQPATMNLPSNLLAATSYRPQSRLYLLLALTMMKMSNRLLLLRQVVHACHHTWLKL